MVNINSILNKVINYIGHIKSIIEGLLFNVFKLLSYIIYIIIKYYSYIFNF